MVRPLKLLAMACSPLFSYDAYLPGASNVAQLRLTPAARVPGSKSPIAAVMLFDGTSKKLSVQLTAKRPGAPSARSRAGCIDSGASP